MLVDNLAVPFQAVVLGVDVTVTGIDLTEDEQITAVCTRGQWEQRIRISICHCLRRPPRVRSGSMPTIYG
jgi:hypothetical protein